MSLASLHRLSLLLGSSLERERECAAFMDWLKSEVGPRRAALFVAAPGRESLILAAASGFRKPPRGVLPAGHDPWSWLEAQKMSLPRGERYALRILLEGELFGLLAVVSAKGGEALTEEQRLLDLALAYLAPILRNIEHYENMERMMEERAAQLRESEERYRNLVISLPELIYALSPEGKIAFLNPVFEQITGWTVSQWLGRSFEELIHPEDQPLVRERFTRALHTRHTKTTIEARIFTASGETRILEILGSARLENGQVTGVSGYARDITLQKQAEEALRKSEEQYRLLFEDNPIPMWVYDLETLRFLAVNKAAILKYGYTRAEFLSMTIKDIHPPEEIAVLLENIASSSNRFQDSGPWKHKTKDGQIIFVEIISHSIEYLGKPARLVMANDITERKTAETRLRSVVEQVPLVTYTESSQGGRKIFVSPQIQALSGYTPEEWMADPALWKNTIHPDDRPGVIAEDDRTNQTGEPFRVEYRLVARSGEIRWVRDEAVLIRDEGGAPLYWQGFMLDITAQKEAEEARRAGEERFRLLVENAADVFYQISLQNDPLRGEVIFVSPQAKALSGHSPEEFLRDPEFWLKSIHPDDLPQVFETTQKLLSEQIPVSREYRLWNVAQNEFRWVADRVTPRFDQRGQLIGYQGVARDITARKRAEELLQRQLAEIQVIYRLSDAVSRAESVENIYEEAIESLLQALKADRASILLFDPDGVMRFKAQRGLSDKYRKAVEGHSPWRRDAQDPQPIFVEDVEREPTLEQLKPVILQEGIRALGFIPLVQQGRLLGKFMIYFNAPHSFAENEIRLAQTIAAHVAFAIERKRAEEAVKHSERRLSALIANGLDFISLLDARGNLLWESPSATSLLGYRFNEFLGRNILELVHPKDLEWVQRQFAEVAAAPGSRQSGVFRMKRADGEYRWVEAVASNFLDDPAVNAIVINYRDITERKTAETRLRSVVEQAPLTTYTESSQDRRTIFISPQVQALSGYTPEEWIADPALWKNVIHPDDRPGVIAEDDRTNQNGEPFHVEYRLIARSGEIRWVRDEAILIRDEGGAPLYWQGFMLDITERKQAEEALRENEEKFKTLFHSANDAIFLMNHTTFLDCNTTTEKIFQCSRDQIIGRSPVDFSPEYQPDGRLSSESAAEKIEAAFAGKPQFFEWLHLHLDGTPFHAEVSLNRVFIGGEFILQAIVRDITERKMAEEALRQAEEKYRNIFENAVEAITQTTPEGRYITANPAAARMLGYDSVEELMASVNDLNTQFYVEPGRREEFKKLIEEQGFVVGFESEIYRKDGSRVWISENMYAVRDEQGNLLYYEGTSEDITKRKKAEEKLTTSEAELRALFASMQDVVLVIDREGLYRKIAPTNPGLLYKPPEELLGKNLRDVFPAEQAEAFLDSIRQALETRQTTHIEYALEINQRLLWFSASISPMDSDNTLWVARDITARKHHERQLEAQAMLARALGESLELQPLLERLLEAARHAIPAAEKGSILLLEADGRLRIRALNGYSDPRLKDFAFASDSGYSARAARERQPVLIADVRADDSIRYDGEIEEARQIHGAIAVPLLIQERVIGVLSLDSTQKNAFTQEDLDHLVGLAASAALVIENARLFEVERRQRQMAEQLSRTLEAGTSLTSLLDFDLVLDRLLESVEQVIPFSGGNIMLISQESGKARIARLRGYSHLDEKARQIVRNLSFDLAATENLRWMYEHEQPLVIPDVSKYPGWISLEGFSIRSWIGAPILINNQVEAFFSLDSLTPNFFTDEHALLLQAFAGQASLALQNARLFEETRRRAEETASLLNASLSLSSLDLQETLQTIGERARALFKADGCRIFLLEPDGKTLRCALALAESEVAFADLTIPLGYGVTGHVALTGEAEIVNDMLGDPRAQTVPGTEEEPEAMMFAPLKSGEKTIGVISIRRIGSERPFQPNDLDLLQAFASLAALAVSNARLFEDMKKRLAELDTLHRSSQSLLVAGFDPQKTYASLHEAVQSVMPSDVFVIVLEDEAGGDYHAVYRYDTGEHYPPARIPRGQGLSGQVIEQNITLLVEDHPARSDIPAIHFGRPEHVRSILAIPLKRGNRTFGMISTQSYQPNMYTDNHRAVLETIAAQFAASIENARLFEDIQRRLYELEILQSLSAALRRAHTAEEMLPLFIQYAAQAVDAAAGSIYLWEQASGEWVSRGWMTADGRWQTDTTDLRHRAGEGVTGWVGERGEIYITTDWRTDPTNQPLPHEMELLQRFTSGISLPLKAEENVIGIMHLWYTGTHNFDEWEKRLLTAVADMAGNAMQRARLHEETAQQVKRLTALRDLDRVISSSFELQLVFNLLLTHAREQLQADAVNILLYDPHTHTLQQEVGRGFRSTRPFHAHVRLGETLAGRAALERRLIAIPDLHTYDKEFSKLEFLESENFKAYYAYPLISKGELKGVLEVFHRAPFHAPPDWLDFFETLAGQAAIAIDNARLFENLERSNLELTLAYDETIEGWSRALDLRDKETEGHTQRVTELTLKLAAQFGIPSANLIHIHRGALLHDIGKMGVPDSILFKSGPLTKEELDIMHQHPQFAYNMLAPIQYLHPALDIPYCHHEKWDGTGYPRGLKGEKIPLPARIFAVADVYDALTSHRPYRKAWTKEQALQYIKKQAGKHFDPQVVKKFMELIAEEQRCV